MDLLRREMMSLLTVLGHSLLRRLLVGREYGALVGKIVVPVRSPSASRSCMASNESMICCRV